MYNLIDPNIDWKEGRDRLMSHSLLKIPSEMPITPQPGEIVFNTMRYRSSETVHRLGYFQSSVSVQIIFKQRK